MIELSSSQKCGYDCDGRSRWWAEESRCNSKQRRQRNRLSDNTESRAQTDPEAQGLRIRRRAQATIASVFDVTYRESVEQSRCGLT